MELESKKFLHLSLQTFKVREKKNIFLIEKSIVFTYLPFMLFIYLFTMYFYYQAPRQHNNNELFTNTTMGDENLNIIKAGTEIAI